MSFERMSIEEWFDEYQFQVDYDIGESGVKFYKVRDLNLELKVGKCLIPDGSVILINTINYKQKLY